MSTILFVMTGVDHWTLADGTRHATGFWAEEAAAPYEAFKAAGHEVVVATPGGVVPAVDKASLAAEVNGGQENADRIERILASFTELRTPIRLEDVNLDDYAAVFYPGGHGPMEDLAYDPISGALLTRVLHSGKPLALLCHAPAATLAAKNEDGSWPFRGYRMTGLSNTEEKLNSFGRKAPWFLEDRLKENGAIYSKARLPLLPYVVNDRNLYTGQNPSSSERLAKHLVNDLSAKIGST